MDSVLGVPPLVAWPAPGVADLTPPCRAMGARPRYAILQQGPTNHALRGVERALSARVKVQRRGARAHLIFLTTPAAFTLAPSLVLSIPSFLFFALTLLIRPAATLSQEGLLLPQMAVSQNNRSSVRDPLSSTSTSSTNNIPQRPRYRDSSPNLAAHFKAPPESPTRPPDSVDPFSHQGQAASASPGYRPINHLRSTSVSNKSLRSSSLLGFAAAALDKTQSALLTRQSSDHSIRQRSSNSALGRLASPVNYGLGSSDIERESRVRKSNNQSPASLPSTPAEGTRRSSQASLVQDPPSQPYTETDPNRPLPIRVSNKENKMHQTSSRLLRMTDDDRPFTKVSAQVSH